MGAETFLAAENLLFTITMILYFAAMVSYFVFFAMKKEKAGKLAGGILTAGFVLHTAALLVRGIGAKRLPLTNQYEFATSFAWGISTGFSRNTSRAVRRRTARPILPCSPRC